jgi:hypothetical protein
MLSMQQKLNLKTTFSLNWLDNGDQLNSFKKAILLQKHYFFTLYMLACSVCGQMFGIIWQHN